MESKTRVILTATLGIALGLGWWLGSKDLGPSPEFRDSLPAAVLGISAVVLYVVAPILVNRWWVLLSLAGPLAMLAFFQIATDRLVQTLDGYAPPLNVESISGLFWLGLGMLLIVGVRKLWDLLRRRRAGSAIRL